MKDPHNTAVATTAAVATVVVTRGRYHSKEVPPGIRDQRRDAASAVMVDKFGLFYGCNVKAIIAATYRSVANDMLPLIRN